MKSEPEALLLEGKLIKQWRPRYNTDFTDDKRFLLVRVDAGEELPRFRLTRLRKEDRSRYFGPFAHSGLLRKTLAQMRRQFGILLADGTPQKLPDGTWRLYDDVREELYGTENIVTADNYRRRVTTRASFSRENRASGSRRCAPEMLAAAGKHEFEKAAGLRDVVFALEQTLRKTRRFERLDPTRPQGDEEALQSLQRALQLPHPPHTMECFDISHISGTLSSPRGCTSPTAGRTRTTTAASRSKASSATTTSTRWKKSSGAATGAWRKRTSRFPISS